MMASVLGRAFSGSARSAVCRAHRPPGCPPDNPSTTDAGGRPVGAAHHTDTVETETIETAVPKAKQLTIETVNLDDEREMDEFDRQVIAAGMERVRAEIKELRKKGLLGAQFPNGNIGSLKQIKK